MLIPSVVALALWLVASGYLVFQGFYNREVANGVRKVSIPAVPALASIQQERRLSVAYLAQTSKDLQGLLEQRQQTDQRLAALRAVADSALANAPQSITTQWKTLTDQLDQIASIRSRVDARSADQQRVYDFYNGLLNTATDLFDTQARIVPDATASQGGIVATETFQASDLMSRAGSTMDVAFGSRTLAPEDHLEFARLVSAYHFSLSHVATHLRPDARARYDKLVASESWKRLAVAEDAIVSAGQWRNNKVPRNLPIDSATWETLTREVSDELIGLTVAQANEVSAEALRTGNNQLLAASLGSLIALAIAIAAIVWAMRQSQVLVDQALSVRLAQLGRDAAAVVDQRLPAIMERLRRRESVDLAVELPSQDYGSDEIGEVADVINRSMQAAAAAAVDEAKTRAAGMAMLMGVARRPQRPLQRGLKVIEDLQNRVGDEKLLTDLFDINHQLAQTRRFLENLVILAGGQIGRRFQKPVPLRRVLLAAFAEAQQYQRITLRSAPDMAVAGHAVAGTIHLLAELLDNALAFSPPTTTVWVTCNQVKRGVAVEIEDAGMGMRPDALERANELLATAPTPDVTALKDGAQVGLHVVAELAKRDGVQVSLRTSAYGGLLAIVLLPDRVMDAGPVVDSTDAGVRRPAAEAARTVPNGAGGSPRVQAPAPAAVGAGPAEARPALPTPRDGESRQRTGGVMSGHQANRSVGIPRQSGSSAATVVDAGSPGPQAAARPALPQRDPQQHIVPQLRDDGEARTASPGLAGRTRSPEEARDRLAAYQQAWAAGRETKTRNDQGGKA
ncbi:sensor histidine kinase [Micromonospora sp. CPCC 205556]|uniref:sensor histidine kinase n=1 Tax=Micromonospora sp. CPCC 205556 TaxID=3122398 RepID=UPI002FF07045